MCRSILRATRIKSPHRFAAYVPPSRALFFPLDLRWAASRKFVIRIVFLPFKKSLEM